MDVRKGWPTQRCAAGAPHEDKTIINRIMLRFRPIAPKPVADGSISGSGPASLAENKGELLVNRKRTKRKYVRVNKNSKCKVTKAQEKIDLNFDGAAVTFQPVQDPNEMKITKGIGSSRTVSFSLKEKSSWIKMDESHENNDIISAAGSDRSAIVRSTKVVESWLVVEGMMTETLLEGGRLGNTDTERMKNLEADTCPGLISDGLHRVQWVNLAYRRMINAEAEAEVVVWLVVKENMPEVIWPVFACTVRVVYTWRKEKHSQTMPCDVWKMDFGGFAWRLDANAALSLGLGRSSSTTN
ncbi:hypothetical protein M9H77_35041 [Catharanthus roseus]|uniref:Uncharacterized protein n=1 Tax=Catharanthus roseus TaxID=4058 RepID=A0ACB9ZP44_CATRO|nr:hypothetical protein M9H77_35041 [Catharanthus roseus]